MTKKAKTICIMAAIALALFIIIGIFYFTTPLRKRQLLRDEYEAQTGMIVDPKTQEIKNAPKGKTPEEAFNLYFKNGFALCVLEYDGNICVLGETKIGAMIVTMIPDSDGTYRAGIVFDRGSDDHPVEVKGDKIAYVSYVQYFRLPGSNSPNEIVHPLQLSGEGTPSDTNHATFYYFSDTEPGFQDWQHWYAFSDVDQEGYCVIWS